MDWAGRSWGRESARKKQFMRRGFTLLETMIVVLIVTAISAMFLPALASRAASGRVGQATQALESGAALAAAEAMERGVIVAFVAEDWEGEWVLWAEEAEPERLAELLAPVGDLPPLPPEESQLHRVEVASFEGVEMTGRLPPVEVSGVEVLGAEVPADGRGEFPEQEPLLPGEHERLVLGIFFPDGSCRAGPTVYLVSDDGRRRVVRFSPLTGRVDVRVLPTEQDEAEQLEDSEGAGSELDLPPPAISTPPERDRGGPP